jgi:hypothetical protein
LAAPRFALNFDAPEKIVMRQTGDSLVAALDRQQYLCLNNMHVIVPQSAIPDLRYILSLLNSKMMNWYYQTLNPEQGEALAEVKKANVAQLPIRVPDMNNPSEKATYDQLVAAVDEMLRLHEQVNTARTPNDQTRLQRQIDGVEKRIDQMVYALYGLTEAEIAIVEAG